MTPLHADAVLAARLELAVVDDFAAYAAVARRVFPADAPARLDAGGGAAFYFGPGSPLNQAVALGMEAPVFPGSVSAIQGFFEERDTQPVVLACPLAHESLFAQLAREGWLAVDFENVLAMRMGDVGGDFPASDDSIFVRVAADPNDRALWANLSVTGFCGTSPRQPHEHIAAVMAARDDLTLLIAEIDGAPAGSAAVCLKGTDAWLLADSTLPALRGRGVQQALQSARLDIARQAGCEMAVTEAKPGGASQRNMERLGFRVLYTRVEFNSPLASPADGQHR